MAITVNCVQNAQARAGEVLKLFVRIEQFSADVDEAFLGQPFLPDQAPDASANIRATQGLLALIELPQRFGHAKHSAGNRASIQRWLEYRRPEKKKTGHCRGTSR
jgi:hypothetical protein